jgi:hypothetical protein
MLNYFTSVPKASQSSAHPALIPPMPAFWSSLPPLVPLMKTGGVGATLLIADEKDARNNTHITYTQEACDALTRLESLPLDSKFYVQLPVITEQSRSAGGPIDLTPLPVPKPVMGAKKKQVKFSSAAIAFTEPELTYKLAHDNPNVDEMNKTEIQHQLRLRKLPVSGNVGPLRTFCILLSAFCFACYPSVSLSLVDLLLQEPFSAR